MVCRKEFREIKRRDRGVRREGKQEACSDAREVARGGGRRPPAKYFGSQLQLKWMGRREFEF